MKVHSGAKIQTAITLAVFLIGILQITGTMAFRQRFRQSRQNMFTCTAPGFYPYPTGDVSQYYQCVMISGVWYYYVYNCPANSGFVPARGLCVIGVTNAPTTTEAATTMAATTDAATTPGATTDAATTPGATTDAATTPGATTDAATTPGATTDAATTPGVTTDSAATTPGVTTDSAATTPGVTTDSAATTPGVTTDSAATTPGATTPGATTPAARNCRN